MTLVLKVLSANGTAYGGFQWNTEIGSVTTCPDWKPTKECGHGLHGWLRGMGDLSASSLVTESGALWLVLSVDESSIVHLEGKVKFPSAQVVFNGSRSECANYIVHNEPNAQGVHFVNLTGGDRATLTGGEEAILTGGDRATLTGGNGATLTGGDRATLTGGEEAILTGGDRAILTGGNWAALTGGNGATLTGGDGAILTGGEEAILTGGDRAILTGGNGATLTGGDRATLTGGEEAILTGGEEAILTGGDRATLLFKCWDRKRRRITVAYVGENNILPGVAYQCVDGNVIPA